MRLSRLILPQHVLDERARKEEAAELGMTEAEVVRFIETNKPIQRAIKKARKAYEHLQETLKYEAEALARSKGR